MAWLGLHEKHDGARELPCPFGAVGAPLGNFGGAVALCSVALWRCRSCFEGLGLRLGGCWRAPTAPALLVFLSSLADFIWWCLQAAGSLAAFRATQSPSYSLLYSSSFQKTVRLTVGARSGPAHQAPFTGFRTVLELTRVPFHSGLSPN
ncbi:hypothetical protein IF1G_08480 [Cordyceps javanica]|uniref:Uncharacterized protein n=1 Tax=Cordyceps javanica TaxID=43265 RepID=A0A545USX2_9HYPO|nr:hypothetical protein IF1G_08480 [Cordyceps javanica]